MSQSIKSIFIERYSRIKDFLMTKSQHRTDEELIDMRNVLEGFPFFIQFTNTKSQDFISMCRHLQIESYESGCTIFNQGDVADKFYMVLTGTVGIFVNIPGGDEQKQVGQLGIGGAFGELALLFNSERNATIKVEHESELIVLHKDDFKKYMKFQSSEYANQAFTLINQMDEFKGLEFPDRVRLASKMDFKAVPSNHTVVQQGAQITQLYIVQSGLIKVIVTEEAQFYRDVEFNTNHQGSISFVPERRKQQRGGRTLKIEIDELGPARFFGEYELFHHRPSQFTAVTHMPCNLFCITQFDFNLMSQYQLQDICHNSKPYPNDDDIRSVFLDGVQWRVFRKQLVTNLKQKVQQVRDPSSVPNEKYHRDLRMFAVNTLSFDRLLNTYVNDNQALPRVKNEQKKHTSGVFSNVDSAIRQTKKEYQLPSLSKSSRSVLPKINIKVGSSVYNMLISN